MNRRRSMSYMLTSIVAGVWSSQTNAELPLEDSKLVKKIQRFTDSVRNRSIEEIIADSYLTAPILSSVIEDVGACIRVGMTTNQINELLSQKLQSYNLLPSMLNYKGFPAASAVSVSPALLHAPPSNISVTDGSLVTIQYSALSERSHASQGWTFPVGSIPSSKQAVVDGAAAALRQAISIIRSGMSTSDISNEIQKSLDERSLTPIQDFAGYTMGHERIQPPNILSYGQRSPGEPIAEGMILNIHVFATTGNGMMRISNDNWTASLKDEEPAALSTAMVLVRADDGVELTRPINTGPKDCNFLA